LGAMQFTTGSVGGRPGDYLVECSRQHLSGGAESA